MTSDQRPLFKDLMVFVKHGAETWKGADTAFAALPDLPLVQHHVNGSRGPDATPEAIEVVLEKAIGTLRSPLRRAALEYFGFTEDAKGKRLTPRSKLAAAAWGMDERDIRRPKKQFGDKQPREWLVEQVADAVLALERGELGAVESTVAEVGATASDISQSGAPASVTQPREHVDVLIACQSTVELDAIVELSDHRFVVSKDVMFGFEVVRFEFTGSGGTPVRLRGVVAVIGAQHNEVSVRTAQFIAGTQPRCVCFVGACRGDEEETEVGDVVFARTIWDRGPHLQLGEAELESDARQFEVPRRWVEVARSLAEGEETEARVRVGDLLTSVDKRSEDVDIAEAKTVKAGTLAVDSAGSGLAEAALLQNTPWLAVSVVTTTAEAAPHSDASKAKAAASFLLDLSAKVLSPHAVVRQIGPAGTDLVAPAAARASESQRALRQKLHLDFANANISGPKRIQSAMQDAKRNLVAAGLVRPGRNDPRLASPDDVLSGQTWMGEPSAKAIKEVAGLGQLVVSCSAIYPAAVAVLLSIKQKYLPGLVLDVNAINSIEVVQHLEQRSGYDLVVAADDPVFLAGGEGTFQYRRILPLLRAPQWIFHREDDTSGRARLLVLATGSSGATQFFSGRAVRNATPEYITAAEIRDRALSLEPGELIPAWEPIASELREVPGLTTLPGSHYEIHVSLYCHRKEWTGSAAKTAILSSFVEVFVSEWAQCNEDLARCCALLEKDENFMWFFSRGAGG